MFKHLNFNFKNLLTRTIPHARQLTSKSKNLLLTSLLLSYSRPSIVSAEQKRQLSDNLLKNLKTNTCEGQNNNCDVRPKEKQQKRNFFNFHHWCGGLNFKGACFPFHF